MDHAGQDLLLPNAKILLQRKELQNAAAPNIYPVPFYDRLNVARLIMIYGDASKFWMVKPRHSLAFAAFRCQDTLRGIRQSMSRLLRERPSSAATQP